MATRLPKPRKPSEQLRRRNRPEEWSVLLAERGIAFTAREIPFVPCLISHEPAMTFREWNIAFTFRTEADFPQLEW
jgi:hypothetical protein